MEPRVAGPDGMLGAVSAPPPAEPAAPPAVSAAPPTEKPLRVMPWWLALLGLLLAVGLGWLVLDWLLAEADRAVQPDTRATLRVDAIRTGLSVVAGTGGGLALLFAARRQWITERGQRHQEAVAARDQAHRDRVQAHAETVAETAARHQERQASAAEHDAVERRLTELYVRAIELVGSDNPAVRLGGLHALERLGQDNPGQRPTTVAVLCAYLRMPAPDDPRETEVRRTAQRTLARHLRADQDTWWPGIALDLTGARLDDFDAAGCTLEDLDLTGAVCTGTTSFAGAVVRGRLRLAAEFADVVFDDLGGDAEIVLDGARITGRASFDRADLGGALSCRGTSFGEVSFRGATLRQPASFDRARFADGATFREAVFLSGLSMEHTTFAADAGFRRVRFADMALFRWTEFGADAWFEGARFEGTANFGRAMFHGPATFEGATLVRQFLVDQARASASVTHAWPPDTTVGRRDGDWLVLTDL
ncbi:pentapeptide repeat-containing protein [Micromonospora sp. WMMC241]|uniref:pentapeptide repeat-containing protein n=1 Tax=Micromonospora sp. WMMC241 TaxID=3015159 RepID=UPI0022B66DFE|nr:pentapeptide repeat-containing protein [Micromonospora sp. WMMC241]MCZ7436425.1 pentapeptide repeat-containing protein [Micromonospora sp. WMMC241]